MSGATGLTERDCIYPKPGENVPTNTYWMWRVRDHPEIPVEQFAPGDRVRARRYRGACDHPVHLPDPDSDPQNPRPMCSTDAARWRVYREEAAERLPNVSLCQLCRGVVDL
jgi:hypothetical protein